MVVPTLRDHGVDFGADGLSSIDLGAIEMIFFDGCGSNVV